MQDLDKKEQLDQPKEAYIKRTLRFLKNAMRNVLKEYYTEASNNMKEKDNLELPTKEKFNKMYSKLTNYNSKKKSVIKLKKDEIKDLWNTAKREITDEVKRLGKDSYDFDKTLADDSLDLVPDMLDNIDGVESLIEIPKEEGFMHTQPMNLSEAYLSTVTLQKLDFLFQNLISDLDFKNWYSQYGHHFLVKLLDNDLILNESTNYKELLDEVNSDLGFTTMIDIKCSKQEIIDLLLKIDMEKTTEQDTFILQIDNIINKVYTQYHIFKNSTDKSLNIFHDITLIQELSKIVGDECAMNLYILFYFNMITHSQIIEIDNLIKRNINN